MVLQPASAVPEHASGLRPGRTIRGNGGCLFGMTGQRRIPASESGRRPRIDPIRDLAKSADRSRGASNLATVPRAGNVSNDTRAGSLG